MYFTELGRQIKQTTTVMIIDIPNKVATMGCHCRVVNVDWNANPAIVAKRSSGASIARRAALTKLNGSTKVPIIVCRSNRIARLRAVRW